MTSTVITRLTKSILPFVEADITHWMHNDHQNEERVIRLLRLLQQGRAGRPPIHALDLFRADHHGFGQIESLANSMESDQLPEDGHLKSCTVCAAFVQTEAARAALIAGLTTDLSGLDAKTPETRTDQDKGFGVKHQQEVDNQGALRRGDKPKT